MRWVQVATHHKTFLGVRICCRHPMHRTYGGNPLICLQGYKDVLIDDDMRVLALRRATLLAG